MEPIAIALIVSVMFNLWCFKEIKTLTKDLYLVTEQNTILQISKDVNQIKNIPKLESLGYVNVYKKTNGNHILAAISRSKQETINNRYVYSKNTLLGTSEVFISTPEK